MDIEKVKKANKKIENLECLQRKIKELKKTENIDHIRIKRYQSGAPEYSYDVMISDDVEFLKTIKSLIKDKLKRDEQKLLQEIKMM